MFGSIAYLVTLLEEALKYIPEVKDEDFPERSHVGACGPEAGCDGACMEIANLAEMQRLRERIKKAIE